MMMPAILNARYVLGVCHKRLRRDDPLHELIALAIGLPKDRNVLAVGEQQKNVQMVLNTGIQKTLSSCLTLLRLESDNARIAAIKAFPPYERFSILLYIAVVASMLEASSHVFLEGELEIVAEAESASGAAGQDYSKEAVKVVLKAAEQVDVSEVSYMIGFEPSDGGTALFEAYADWFMSVLHLHRMKLKKRHDL